MQKTDRKLFLKNVEKSLKINLNNEKNRGKSPKIGLKFEKKIHQKQSKKLIENHEKTLKNK